MTKLIKIIFVMLLIGVITISSIYIYMSLKEDVKAENEFKEIAAIVEESNQNNATKDNKEDVTQLDLEGVYKINSDVIGWLRIAGTNINYPVMQSKYKYNYYLRRNIYKEYSLWGTPYLAEECDIHTSSNLIVYGHHIQNEKLFGELEKYKSREFLENHKIIEFTTLDKTFYYKIIDIVVKDISDTAIQKYYNPKYSNESEKQLLTLSTCEYSTPNGRLLIIAEQIDN